MLQMRWLLLAVVAAACAGARLPAVTVRSIDAELEAIRAERDVPALAAVVLERGSIVAAGAVGARRRGTADRVAASDSWHIGSCAKAMTAAVIARLVDAGATSWSATMAEVFPRTGRQHASAHAVRDRPSVARSPQRTAAQRTHRQRISPAGSIGARPPGSSGSRLSLRRWRASRQALQARVTAMRTPTT